VKLTQSSYEFGMSRIRLEVAHVQAEAAAHSAGKIVRDATDTVILGHEQPHEACTLRALEYCGCKSRFERMFPMISEAGKSSECVIAILLLAGCASGFIGSVVGTSRRVLQHFNFYQYLLTFPAARLSCLHLRI
jgi:hypothetical protein